MMPWVITIGLIGGGIAALSAGSRRSRDRVRRLKQSRYRTQFASPVAPMAPPPLSTAPIQEGHPEIVLDLESDQPSNRTGAESNPTTPS
jgi:hypothetical protein